MDDGFLEALDFLLWNWAWYTYHPELEPPMPVSYLTDDGDHMVWIIDRAVGSGYDGLMAYVFLELPVSGVVPLRNLADQLSWNGSFESPRKTLATTSASEILAAWILQSWDLWIDFFTNRNPWTVESDHANTYLDEQVETVSYVRQLVVSAPAQVVALTVQALMGLQRDAEETYTFRAAAAGRTAAVSGAGTGALLVDGVTQLAQQDIDVSVNHGAAIYSVRSCEVTEP